MACPVCESRRRQAGSLLDGPHDVLVASAAADVSVEPVANLLLGRFGVVLQDLNGGHDHPRRAVTALKAVTVAKRLLHRMQLVAARNALDSGDRRTLRLQREHRA